MHRTHLFALALPPIVGTLLITSAARSADLVVAGTPEQEGVVVGNGIHQGLQLEGNVGTGFNDPYPLRLRRARGVHDWSGHLPRSQRGALHGEQRGRLTAEHAGGW